MGLLDNLGKLGGVFGLAGSLFGSSSAAKAQAQANATNLRINKENREWMENMSNTEWQRGVKDMSAAGLNPMLAYSQGGANTPQNSAATVIPEDAMGRGIERIGRDIPGWLSTAAQIENVQANTSLTRMRADQERVIRDRMIAETIGGGDLPPSIQDIRWGRERDEATQARADADMKRIEARVMKELENTRISSGKKAYQILEEELSFQEARAILEGLKIPEAEAMASWFRAVGAASPAAKATMSVGNWLKMILGRGR